MPDTLSAHRGKLCPIKSEGKFTQSVTSNTLDLIGYLLYYIVSGCVADTREDCNRRSSCVGSFFQSFDIIILHLAETHLHFLIVVQIENPEISTSSLRGCEIKMIKLEIKLDDKQIASEAKYCPDSLYNTMDKVFAKYHFHKEEQGDGSICYYGNGMPRDFGIFGRLITTLKDKDWFMTYLTKWLWYNSDDGEDENDYSVDDILYHYTKRESDA